MSFDVNEVRTAAEGRWPEICAALAPQLAPALERIGTHVPCPVHGGQDGFRLFKDFPKSGGGICNTCGAKPDGFELISWVNGWSFSKTVNAVAATLGLRDRRIPAPIRPVAKKGSARRVGRLVETGEAPYRFLENVPLSFYLKLRKEDGRECVFWGKDLARAVESSGARPGDWIAVTRLGKQLFRINSHMRELTAWSVVKCGSPEEKRTAEAEEAKRTADEDARRAERIETVVARTLAAAGFPMERVDRIASAEIKQEEPGLLEFARRSGLPIDFFDADALNRVAVPHPSEAAEHHLGVHSVSEAAALLAAGPGARLVIEKTADRDVTLAVAEEVFHV